MMKLIFFLFSFCLFLHHTFQRKSNRIRMGVREICLRQLHEHNPQSFYPAKIHSFALLVAKVRIEIKTNTGKTQRVRELSAVISWSFLVQSFSFCPSAWLWRGTLATKCNFVCQPNKYEKKNN